MADFDPAKYLSEKGTSGDGGGGFDPAKYLAEKTTPVAAEPSLGAKLQRGALDAYGGLTSVLGSGGESIGARVPLVGSLGKNLGERFRAGVDYAAGGGEVPYSALLQNIRDQEAEEQAKFKEEHPGANLVRNIAGGLGTLVLPIPGAQMGGLGGAAVRTAGALTGAGTDALLRTEDPDKVRQAATLAGGLQAGLEAIPVVGKAGKIVAEAGEPLAEKASGLQTALRDKIFQAGELLTGGNLKAAQASKAADQLPGRELIFPGSENFGPLQKAGEAVGAAREAIGTAGPRLEGVAPNLQKVRDIIANGEERALRTPGSQAVLEKLDRLIGQSEETGGVPLQAVDDLVRNLDEVGYTALGNQRGLSPMWKGPVTSARRELNSLLQGADEGQALQAAKDQYSALATAAKSRSKLMEGLSNVGAAASTGALAHGVTTGNPVALALGATAAVVSKAMSPRTYFQIVGAAKLPADAVNALMDSYSSGNVLALRDTLAEMSQRYPAPMARVVQTLTNEAVANDQEQPAALPGPPVPPPPNNDTKDAIRRRIGE